MSESPLRIIFREIVNSIDVGVMIIDPETHRIVEANSYMGKLVGLGLDDIIGEICHTFVCPSKVGNCPITDQGYAGHKKECTLLNLDREEIPIYKTVKRIVIKNKEYLLESFVDIREYKTSQQLLHKAYNDLNVFEKQEQVLKGYKEMIDSIDDIIIIVDSDYRLLMVNDTFCKERNVNRIEVLGKTINEVLGPVIFEKSSFRIDEAFRGHTSEFHMTYTRQFTNVGRNVVLLIKIIPVFNEDQRVESVLVLTRDITEFISAIEEKRRIFNLSADIISIGDTKGQIMDINPAWEKILGWNIEASRQKKWIDFVHMDDIDRTKEMVKHILNGEELTDYEVRFMCQDGTYRWLSWNGFTDTQSGCVYAVARDITSRKEGEVKLLHLAMTDPLTGISNRRHFLERFKIEIARCRRYQRAMAYLTFDIDDFKHVNDRYGHDMGDETIVKITQIGTYICRESDEFGRLGGEEFGILLPETNLEEARVVAERLRKTIEETTIVLNGYRFNITISIGLTQHTDSDDMGKMMKRADKALYFSKDSGKNQVKVL